MKLGFILVSITIITLSCSQQPSNAQINEYANNEVNTTGEDSIPRTTQIIDTNKILQKLIDQEFKECKLTRVIKGDLNADGKEDILAISTRKCKYDETVSDNSICHRTYLFIAQNNGDYKLKKHNDQIISCSDCEHGMPEIKISSGEIIIKRTLGACTRDIFTEFYRYDKNNANWYLKEIKKATMNCNEIIDHEIVIKELPSETVEDFGEVQF